MSASNNILQGIMLLSAIVLCSDKPRYRVIVTQACTRDKQRGLKVNKDCPNIENSRIMKRSRVFPQMSIVNGCNGI